MMKSLRLPIPALAFIVLLGTRATAAQTDAESIQHLKSILLGREAISDETLEIVKRGLSSESCDVRELTVNAITSAVVSGRAEAQIRKGLLADIYKLLNDSCTE